MDSTARRQYARHEDVVTREILGETLLVPISASVADMGHIFALNDTGAFVWERLDGATPLDAIRDALADTFEVSAETAWADLSTLIDELAGAGLVHRID